MAGSEQAFREAFVHRFRDAYGPFRYLSWALSPERVYQKMADTHHLLCRFSQVKVVEMQMGAVRMRYTTTRPESRLACVSRQALVIQAPTWWGLPPAELTERACVAEGDEFCEYDLRFFSVTRRIRSLAGAGLGGLLVLPLHAMGLASPPVWLLLSGTGDFRELTPLSRPGFAKVLPFATPSPATGRCLGPFDSSWRGVREWHPVCSPANRA